MPTQKKRRRRKVRCPGARKDRRAGSPWAPMCVGWVVCVFIEGEREFWRDAWETDGSCSVLLVCDLGEVTTLTFLLYDPKNNSFLRDLLEPGKGNNKQKCHAHSQNSVSGDYFWISHVGGSRCECGWQGFPLPSLSPQAQLPTASIYISFPTRFFFFFSGPPHNRLDQWFSACGSQPLWVCISDSLYVSYLPWDS